MKAAERWLVRLIRFNAICALLAVLAVFMPPAWMNAIHVQLGMGELPKEPIVSYLSRSLSAFYVMGGAVAMAASFDVRRYAPIIKVMAYCMLASGAASLWIDMDASLPWFWTASEGPYGLLVGGLTLLLQRRLARAEQPSRTPSQDRVELPRATTGHRQVEQATADLKSQSAR